MFTVNQLKQLAEDHDCEEINFFPDRAEIRFTGWILKLSQMWKFYHWEKFEAAIPIGYRVTVKEIPLGNYQHDVLVTVYRKGY